MSALGQVAAITQMSLRSIPDRSGSSLVIVFGMAAVVAVVISVLSMSTGFLETVNKTGRPDRAIVTSGGAVSESVSSLPRDSIPTILDAAHVLHGSDGKPVASGDIFAYEPLTKKSDGLIEPGTLHGIGPEAFALLPQIRLVSGRMFRPAVHELIAGKMMLSQFEGIEIGGKLSLAEGDWTIVGSFESNGDQHESELLGDVETMMTAYRRSSFNSVTVMLDSPDSLVAFKDSLTANPALNVDVIRETDYFAKLSKPLNDFLTLVAYAVGGIMGLGAVFAALNTMYAAVGTRSLEIATLRAIGFGAVPIVVSVLAEAFLLTLLGATLGAAVAWGFFNGNVVVSDYYIYTMVVKPSLLAFGIAMAIGVGLVGGLFPAIRAARLPIAAALRAT